MYIVIRIIPHVIFQIYHNCFPTYYYTINCTFIFLVDDGQLECLTQVSDPTTWTITRWTCYKSPTSFGRKTPARSLVCLPFLSLAQVIWLNIAAVAVGFGILVKDLIFRNFSFAKTKFTLNIRHGTKVKTPFLPSSDYPPLKLTVRTWKWMVGIRSFPAMSNFGGVVLSRSLSNQPGFTSMLKGVHRNTE